jgi:hypothetical protein
MAVVGCIAECSFKYFMVMESVGGITSLGLSDIGVGLGHVGVWMVGASASWLADDESIRNDNSGRSKRCDDLE